MKKICIPVMGSLLLCFVLSAQETSWSSLRPDGHAPIHVMGDHMHTQGEFMFSYRFMTMNMKGMLSESSEIQNATVFENYMAAPQQMTMNMHMLGFMYAPSDKLTLMVMGNYISNSMDLQTKMNVDFETSSKGFGDISVAGLLHLLSQKRQKVHANVGISIPTGSLDQRGDTPMMDNVRLAYPMQLGSGTWDPYFGATYLGQSDKTSWGFQSLYKFRLGENSEGYTLGNQWSAGGWYAFKATKSFSFSGSLDYFKIGSIDGKDAELNPMMMPLFNANNSGRNQLNLGLGSNYLISDGVFKNLRLALEVTIPLSQSVEGIQMKNGLMSTFGVQYALGHH